ncbi:MAG: geranylgeranylglyceryl/heptaprenylglyceryl phosphate synthase [Bacteroidales bacterium]|nr:geranylgeranylglyceryl/heptaprenylglyceryl phosphate synthase [Bacteroidales bacterium]
MIYPKFIIKGNKKKFFALLIDPENYSEKALSKTVKIANENYVDLILLGGSLVSETLERPIELIKSLSNIPVFLFPGSLLQLSGKADGILLLSLISGRNPEFLIGNHVLAAPLIKKYGLEVIPTGYILIGNSSTAVEYMSNTTPIPSNKTDITVATAMAGEMLGQKLIYLEGGSGASQTIPEETIRKVKKNISIPLVIGGGIKTGEDAFMAYKAGADMIVVGNAIEKNPELINEITYQKLKFN